MSVYRLTSHIMLGSEDKMPGHDLARTLWLGLRFDARVVGAFTLLLLLLSFMPGLHFFRTSGGKYTALVLLTAFCALGLLFYTADFICLVKFKDRLSKDIVWDKDATGKNSFSYNVPWLIISLSIGSISWICLILIKALHARILKSTTSVKNIVRIYWQTVVILLCLAGIWGRLGLRPLDAGNGFVKNNLYASNLALNPVVNYFSNQQKIKRQLTLSPTPLSAMFLNTSCAPANTTASVNIVVSLPAPAYLYSSFP